MNWNHELAMVCVNVWEVPLHAGSYVRSPQYNCVPNSRSLCLELRPKRQWFVCLNTPFDFALT